MDSLDYFDWLELVSRTFDLRLLANVEDNLAVEPRFGSGWKTAIQKYRVEDTDTGPVVMEYNINNDPRYESWEPSKDPKAIQMVLDEHEGEMGWKRKAHKGGPSGGALEPIECPHCDEGKCGCRDFCECEGQLAHEPGCPNCTSCHGSGECSTCEGSGFILYDPNVKRCSTCKGNMYFEMNEGNKAGDPRQPRDGIDIKTCPGCGGKSIKFAHGDTCSACGGSGDCPREQTDSHYNCDLCHGDNHCAYCGRRPQICWNCGNYLQQYNDGHVSHNDGTSWPGFEEGHENLRHPVDPRGPLLKECDDPKTQDCPDCQGHGCDNCNQTGWRGGIEGRWVA